MNGFRVSARRCGLSLGLLLFVCLPAAAQPLATASSEESVELSAAHAFDGDPATRWSSAFSDPQWLQIDLGETRVITGLVLRWEAAYARAYEVLVSEDGARWARAWRTDRGDGGVDEIHFGRRVARYVKILGLGRATAWGYSLFEAEILGPEHEIVFNVSSTRLNTSPQNVLDRDTRTIWRSCNCSDSAWFEMLLPAPRALGAVRLEWGELFPRAWRLLLRADGDSAWRVVHAESGASGGISVVTGLAGSCHGLRIEMAHPGTGRGYSLREVELLSWDECAAANRLDRVRGLAGWEGEPRSRVFTGQDGSFALVGNPWAAGFWVLDETSRRLFTPETMETRWRLFDGRAPVNVVEWEGDGFSAQSLVFVERHGSEPVIYARLRLTNVGNQPLRLVAGVVLRSNELERNGGRMERVEIRDGDRIQVNGAGPLVALNPPVDEVRGEGDLFPNGHVVLSGGGDFTDTSGTGCAVLPVRFDLPPGESRSLDLAVGGSPQDLDAALARALAFWRARTSLVLDLPDTRYRDAFYSSLNYLLVLANGTELHPGPLNYNCFFLHDAVEMVQALDAAGLHGFTTAALSDSRFAYNPAGNYEDELGGGMFILYEHYRYTRDKDWLRAVYPRLRQGAEMIRSRRSGTTAQYPSGDRRRGLLPPSASQDNFTRPAHLYLDDWWAACGLRAAARAAAALGERRDARWMEAECGRLLAAMKSSFATVMKRDGLDYVPGFADDWPDTEHVVDAEHRILGDAQMAWAHRPAFFPGKSLGLAVPQQLLARSYARYWRRAGRFSGYDGGWFVEYENLFWGYNVKLAHPLLYTGMIDIAQRNLEWSLLHPACPGGWMEAMPSRVNEHGLREIAPGIVGDVPHGWVAAHYMLLLRDMLYREDGDRLVITPAIPAEWLESGKRMTVGRAPTYFGEISFSLERAGRMLIVEIAGACRPPGGFTLQLPAGLKTAQGRTSVTVKAGKNRIALR